MRHILSVLVFCFAFTACLAREVKPQRSVDIEIKQRPCVIAVTADGELVFELDATERGIECVVEAE